MRRFSLFLLGCSVFAASPLLADEAPLARPLTSAPAASANAAIFSDVSAARAKANAENRPLLIHVGSTSAGSNVVAAFPNAVHCQCASFHGSSESRLLIPAGEGSYTVFDGAQLASANLAEIRSVVERAPVSSITQPVAAPFAATTFAPSSCAGGQCGVPATMNQAVTTYASPISGGCANGQCGTSQPMRTFASPASGGCVGGRCGTPATFFRRR
jgi:hypothetical protein